MKLQSMRFSVGSAARSSFFSRDPAGLSEPGLASLQSLEGCGFEDIHAGRRAISSKHSSILYYIICNCNC